MLGARGSNGEHRAPGPGRQEGSPGTLGTAAGVQGPEPAALSPQVAWVPGSVRREAGRWTGASEVGIWINGRETGIATEPCVQGLTAETSRCRAVSKRRSDQRL